MKKQYIKDLIIQLFVFAAAVLIEMLLLSILMHINFLKTTVYIYYYRCLYYCFISGVILMFVFFLLRLIINKRNNTDFLKPNTVISSVIIAVLFAALFSTAGLMTMDRSYSIFSIADMYDNSNKIYTADDIEQAFIQKYVLLTEATKRRISEQESIHNIEKMPEGYKITKKGLRLVKMFRLIEKLYPVDDKRTLYPGLMEGK